MTADAQPTDWLQLDVRSLHAAAAQLHLVISAGWSLSDSLGTMRLRRTGIDDVSGELALIDAFGASLLEVRIIGRAAGSFLELRRIGTSYEVTSLPEVAVEDLFDELELRELARRAWERDAEAALGLPLNWEIEVDLGLERLLIADQPIDLRVNMWGTTLEAAFVSATPSDLHSLFPRDSQRRVYVALDSTARPLHLGSVTVAGLSTSEGLLDTLLIPPSRPSLPGERVAAHSIFADAPTPTALLPLEDGDDGSQWSAVRANCEALAALMTWIMIASDVTTDGEDIVLDIRGFKRVKVELPQSGSIDPLVVEATQSLHAWTFHDASPDRLLAVRQVVSLYSDGEAIQHPTDIRESAEVVYAGLRSDSVAEAFKGVREAQSQTLDAVRDTLKSVQELAKSATERFLAAVVAVGAVVVANETQSVSNKTSRDLMLLIALFLMVLALFAVFVEGPLLSLPLDKMESDLTEGLSLLTDEQRERVTTLPSVKSTKTRVLVLRIAVPVVYIGSTISILLAGFPTATGK